ncbi:phage tail tape measure protein [Variovorax saccharolyticus]|uniref:phage tail tape measure protein n=1 Tax=Variovorax saccharolyticus TaxID=3053516 RepID=UPI002574F627|nr:hypothetical protein [Variovorax sp. J31P216]MDM0024073.1 hypothetical protein [Variovorax sp. J31P216]
MSIGRITVDLLARTGSFETDLGRAAKTAEKRAKEIDAAVSKAGAAVGVALSAAAVAAVHFGKQLIDGLDALNDVKDATGASIENLSALEDVAVRTGTSMDSVSGILVKFNSVLKEADGKNAASQVLKKLGLDAEELKRIDPAEALRQTAVALAGFADDGDKARAVQELFGKSVKEAAPFLKDLSEQTQLLATVTTQEAEAAEAFNKQLFALQKSATDFGRAIIRDLLPGLNLFLQNMRDIQKLGGTGLAAKDAFLGFLDPNFATMTGDNGADIKKLMRERDRLQKDLAFASKKGFATRGIEDNMAENAKFLEIVRAKQRNEVEASLLGQDLGDAVSRKAGRAPSMGSISAVKDPKKPGAPKESEFQRYMENLGKQLDKTKELTVAETVLADISSGRLKLLKNESAGPLLEIAKQIDAAKSLAEYTKLAQAAETARTDELLKSTIEQEKQAQSLADGNKAMREEIELMGKSTEAQIAIEQARLSSAIAIKEEELARLAGTEAFERESDAIREQIKLLTDRKDLVAQKGIAEKLSDEAKKSADFARDVGAAFESSFEKAVLAGDKLSDVLQGLGKDVLALTLRQTVTGPLSSGIGDALKGFDFSKVIGSVVGMFGGARASGGPVDGGMSYLVGENGPEMFTPNTAGAIIPNHALSGGAPTVNNFSFTVGDVATVSMVRNAIATSQKQAAGALGRSQRYGGALA